MAAREIIKLVRGFSAVKVAPLIFPAEERRISIIEKEKGGRNFSSFVSIQNNEIAFSRFVSSLFLVKKD